MNARLQLSAIGAAALLLAGTAHAQSHLKPGLWDETVTVKLQMGDRAMPGGGVPKAMRVCVTKEQIARGYSPEDNGRCTRSNVTHSGSVTKFEFSCASARGSVTGQGTATEMGDSAFAVNTSADSNMANMTMHIQTDIAGKFVSSDCGDVKPYEPPPAR